MQLNDMPGTVITFVVIAVMLGIAATILSSIKQNDCGTFLADGNVTVWNATTNTCRRLNQSGFVADAYSQNATQKGIEGLDKMAQWQPTLAIIVVAAVVIGVIGYFYVKNKN